MWPFSTIRRLRDEAQSQEYFARHWRERAYKAEAFIADLQAELEQARKNDMPRDKNGRFVSKVSHV
jgi:hypothetical protein